MEGKEIERKLKSMAYALLLDEVMELQDQGNEELTVDSYIKMMKVEFHYFIEEEEYKASALNAILEVTMEGEHYLTINYNIAG